MAPLLIKVEEILVATRTQRAPRLSSYYLHWEKELFEAVGKLYFSLELEQKYLNDFYFLFSRDDFEEPGRVLAVFEAKSATIHHTIGITAERGYY